MKGRELVEVPMNRMDRILEIVMDQDRVEVAALAQLLGVSAVTVRKDLDQLAERGLIRREHGYATIVSQDDLAGRLAHHHELKRRIAAAAAESLPDGCTIMVESGSTCALLAQELCRVDRRITIVTNSAFIAGYVRGLPGAHVVLLGGDYQNQSQCLVGPLARLGVRQFYVPTAFVGCDGYVPGIGFTGRDHHRAEVVAAMAEQAERIVVLTESSKLTRRGAVALLASAQVGELHTDDQVASDVVGDLAAAGVLVKTVPFARP